MLTLRATAVVVLALVFCATAASAAKTMPSVMTLTNTFLEELMSLPLPALRSILQGPQVPDTTGGCHTGLEGGQAITTVDWPTNVNAVSFSGGNTVTASTTGIQLGGAIRGKDQGCSFACISCIFDDEKEKAHKRHSLPVAAAAASHNVHNRSSAFSANNASTADPLGCGFLHCCCGHCQATVDWQLHDVQLNLQWSFGTSSGGRVTAIVEQASFSVDWGKISVARVSCTVLFGLITISLSNIWSHNIGGFTASFQPQMQQALNSALATIDDTVCSATAAGSVMTLATYANMTTRSGPCMTAPPLSSFPLPAQTLGLVAMVYKGTWPITIGTLCHSTPTCLHIANIPNYNNVVIQATNCAFCVGIVEGNGYLGLSATITTSGLPTARGTNHNHARPHQPPRPAVRVVGAASDNHMQPHFGSLAGPLGGVKKTAAVHRKHMRVSKKAGARNVRVAGAAAAAPSSNCTTIFSAKALSAATKPVAAALQADLASFVVPAKQQYGFNEACEITYPQFSFAAWSGVQRGALEPVVTVLGGSGNAVSVSVAFPNFPFAALEASVPVPDVTCTVPTQMMTQLTQHATGTIAVRASAAAAPAFEMTLAIDPATQQVAVAGTSVAPAGAFSVSSTITTTVLDYDGTAWRANSTGEFVFQAFTSIYATTLAAAIEAEMNAYVSSVLQHEALSAVNEQLARFPPGAVCGLEGNSGNLVLRSGSSCGSGAAAFPAPIAALGNSAAPIAFQIAAGPIPQSPPFNAAASAQNGLPSCSFFMPSTGSLASEARLVNCNVSTAPLGSQLFITALAELQSY